MPRRVCVNAREGEAATVVVTVVQGDVWLSIRPVLTWEVIMKPGMVDAAMRVLELALEEARAVNPAKSPQVCATP